MSFLSLLEEIIRTTAESFDFGFVISVNVIAYLVISAIDANNGPKPVKTWTKRVITIACAFILGIIYFSLKLGDVKVLINSIILAPVVWSWIIKPILVRFGIDYRNTYNKSEEEAKSLLKELESENCSARIFKADISKIEEASF